MVKTQRVYLCEKCRKPFLEEEKELADKCCNSGHLAGFMCGGCTNVHSTEVEANICCGGLP